MVKMIQSLTIELYSITHSCSAMRLVCGINAFLCEICNVDYVGYRYTVDYMPERYKQPAIHLKVMMFEILCTYNKTHSHYIKFAL